MEGKKEIKIAYAIAVILFLVGIVAYAAYPAKIPEQPIRMVLKGIGGNVLFDHKKHTSEDGYGFKCKDCHHDMEDEKDKATACGECHKREGGEAVRRADAFHNQCNKCHEDGGMGPVTCSGCHMIK